MMVVQQATCRTADMTHVVRIQSLESDFLSVRLWTPLVSNDDIGNCSEAAKRYLPFITSAQVADFGLSHARSSSCSAAGPSSSIPVRWAAPEVLTQQAWSSASEVWAFGVVLWEIFSNGSEPYAAQSDQEVS
jgi:serine/threonine protein kinase